MVTKDELKAYVRLTQEIDSMEELITRLQSKKDNIGAARLSAATSSGSGSPDKIASNMARLDDLINRYHEKLEIWLIRQKKIEEVIDSLPECERLLMRYRYIMGMEWTEIANELHYSWRQTHRIHAKALEKLKI